MSTDRLSEGYNPNFDVDLEVGKQGELFVTNVIQMFTDGTGQIEVKSDQMIARTGNVYVEYQCKRRTGWALSGIADTKALMWAFVLPSDVLIVAPVEAVRELVKTVWWSYRTECRRGSHPTCGVAVPLRRFVADLYRFRVPAPERGAA